MNKQIENSILLKYSITYNTKKHNWRIRTVQSNNKKVKYLYVDDIPDVHDIIAKQLDDNFLVSCYSYIIDNTDNKYYMFNVFIKGKTIPNLIK